MIVLLALSLSAHADIAPPRMVQKRPTRHELRVDNMADHPGFVLLAYDSGEKLAFHLEYTAGGETLQAMHEGKGAEFIKMEHPSLYVLPADQLAPWKAEVDKILNPPPPEPEPEKEPCAEDDLSCLLGDMSVIGVGVGGGGSNFGGTGLPSLLALYPPPEGAVPCDVSIDVRHSGDVMGPDRYVSVVRIDEASETACKARYFGEEKRRGEDVVGRALPVGIGAPDGGGGGGAAAPAAPEAGPAPEAAPAEATEVEEAKAGGCATVTSAASFGAGLLLLTGLGWRRRR